MAELSNHPPRHIVISGWYGHENVGDEAMLAVLLKALEQRNPQPRYTVLSERPDRVLAVHSRSKRLAALDHPIPYGFLRALDRDVWMSVARNREAVRTSSLFVLGGGSLLRDRGRGNYLRLLDELWFAQSIGVRTAVVGVSAGPLKRLWGRAITRRLLSSVDLLSVRDEESRRVLIDLGIDPRQISMDGDLTLAIAPKPLTQSRKENPILVAPCRAMLTGLRDGAAGNSALIGILASTLDDLIAATGARVEFVPFRCAGEDEDDAELCGQIHARMKSRDRALVAPHSLDANAVKQRFASARLVIAARLHALHFALHGGTPSFAIAYGQKVSRLFDDLGLAEFALEPRAATTSALASRLARLQTAGAPQFANAREILDRQATRVEAMLARLSSLARR